MKNVIAILVILTFGGLLMAENPMVVLETNHGNITIELYADKAPITVKNFLTYVNDGFYDETVFHRVISNFMIQGGGFTADGGRKETMTPIKNEADNGLKNDAGTIAMARTQQVNSATSQFFINVKDNDFLNHGARDFGYCVFGKVIEGLDVVKKIENVKTGMQNGMRDWPVEEVIIKKAYHVTQEEE